MPSSRCPRCQIEGGHTPECARESLADDIEMLDAEEFAGESTDKTILPADFGDDKTPTAPLGTCWRRCGINAVTVVAQPPGSSHQAAAYTECVAARSWAYCAVTLFLRLGKHELYVGPDRRTAKRIPFDPERRRLPPVPPREDD